MSYITVDELRIASPCTSAEWSDLKGGDRARLCTTCDKNVYNLSLMTLAEANDLIREKEGKLCIELYHGVNGKVLTADAPPALRAIRRKYLIARMKAIGLALAIWGFITGTTTSCQQSSNPMGYFYTPAERSFGAELNNDYYLQPDSIVYGINDTTVNEILIKATAIDQTSMWIFIDSTERDTGTYINHHGVFPAGGYLGNFPHDTNFWYAGELKITSINSTHASGTFWFNARGSLSTNDTVSVTNGRFDVPINFGKIPH